MAQDPCVRPPAFPRRIDNRPALPRIGYRIGGYGDVREFLLRRLDDTTATPELALWSHREPDDPGIALLEGAAALCDVLTFYQELYANEAFLRTARRRWSVGELVRLLGYRLAPGLGGRGTFAVEVRPGGPVTVPAGLTLQVELAGADEPASFETAESVVAYPELGRFHLHRPLDQPRLATGTTELWLRSTRPFEVAEDDRLILAGRSASDPELLLAPQIVVVDQVRALHGLTIVRIRGALRRSSPVEELVGFRLGRSFRHFGHNAPAQEVTIVGDRASARTVGYGRSLSGEPGSPLFSLASSFISLFSLLGVVPDTDPGEPLAGRDLPLDQAVPDFAAGGKVICTYRDDGGGLPATRRFAFESGTVTALGSGGGGGFGLSLGLTAGVTAGFVAGAVAPGYLTVVRTVTALREATLRWGSLTGPTTFLTLDDDLAAGGATRTDVRTVEVHEVIGAPLQVRARPVDAGAASGRVLYFHGPASAAAALDGRRVMLAPPAGEATLAAVTVRTGTSPVPHLRDLHEVTLDAPVSYADFPQEPEEATAVAVYGNLVDADQGKSEREAVLGSGDGRRSFQTFKLPKAPLTYHYAPSETPPQVPDLEVRVADRPWERVDSLYGQGPEARVYVVREDPEGASWVQFGDGERFGARLPSGVENVVAHFRTGIGAHGPLKPGTRVQPGRLERLDRVRLPGVVSGGDAAETGEVARDAAPGRVRSLGRMVGLSDFESEALGIAGVALAAAAWEVRDGVPAVVVTVLMASGRSGEYDAVAEALRLAARERGPDRFEVEVREGGFREVRLHLRVALAPGHRAETVRRAVAAALGVETEGDEAAAAPAADGLFSQRRRRFGQAEHASRVAAVVQNVPGVAWVRLERFEAAGGGRALRSALRRRTQGVACPPDRVLRLVERAGDHRYRLTLATGGEGGGS